MKKSIIAVWLAVSIMVTGSGSVIAAESDQIIIIEQMQEKIVELEARLAKLEELLGATEEKEVEESEKEINTGEMTMGQKNALDSAKQFLKVSAFSHDDLIEMLEYDGYTNEEAVFAVENCGADWNEQAAKSAKSYLDTSSFSKEGLIEMLEYAGFTHEQAVYGAEANGY